MLTRQSVILHSTCSPSLKLALNCTTCRSHYLFSDRLVPSNHEFAFTAHYVCIHSTQYIRRHIRQEGLHEAFFLLHLFSLPLDILIIGGDDDDEIGRSKTNGRDNNNASSQDAGWPRQSEVKTFSCLLPPIKRIRFYWHIQEGNSRRKSSRWPSVMYLYSVSV